MRTLLSCLLPGFVAITAAAQTLTIPWHTIDGGGGTRISTGGIFRVSGTLGQPDASSVSHTGGVFRVTGGFWTLPVVVQTPGAPTLTILALNPTQARISWEPNTAGYVLQETATLTPPNWVNSPSGAANPVTVPSGPDAKFYRLGPVPAVLVEIETSFANVVIPEGDSHQVGIRLTAQPPANTTVTVSSAATAIATVSPATLTFTPANWNTFQQVTVNSFADANSSDEATTLQVTLPGSGNRTVGVYVVDSAQGTVASVSSLVVGEAGSANFTVRLAAQPAATITVFLNSAGPAKATVSPATLIFTPANWNTPQLATVSGVNDANTQNENLVVQLSSGLTVPVQISVIVVDDDP